MDFNQMNDFWDLKQFGEFGDVNPSVTDSATYTFLGANTMEATFRSENQGCFLYSRHWCPSNKYLAEALSALEGSENAWVTASGMSAITCSILQTCSSGDHIITSGTVYGGTFAFFKNWLPKINIQVTFVNILDLEEIQKSIQSNTKVIYTETMSNPLLNIADLPAISVIAKKNNIKLIVDNTFTPLIFQPLKLGADIVVYSMTKYLNGKGDQIAGAICGSNEFINSLIDVNKGTCMLLGPTLDSMRSASILKNLHTLHIRMVKHSQNASYIAQKFKENNIKVIYPGLEDHPGHQTMLNMMNKEYGFGGMMAVELKDHPQAIKFMEKMQSLDVGYLAVSLGYFRTLFSASGSSTSSEVPESEQKKMGLSKGLVRMSIGLDPEITRTFDRMKQAYDFALQ